MTKYINIINKQYPVDEVVVSRYLKYRETPGFVDTRPAKFAPVTEIPKPVADYKTIVTEGRPVLVEGVWTQTWNVKHIPEEQAVKIFDAQVKLVRDERNLLLAKSDWTQLSDSPVNKQLWAEYRAALRNITEQESFPFNITWPIPPSL